MSFTNGGFHRFPQFWGYQWSVKSLKNSTMVVLKTFENPWWRRCSTAETAAWPDWSSVQRASRRPRLKSLRTCTSWKIPRKTTGEERDSNGFFLNGMCTTDFAIRMYPYYIDHTCIMYIYICTRTHTIKQTWETFHKKGHICTRSTVGYPKKWCQTCGNTHKNHWCTRYVQLCVVVQHVAGSSQLRW